MSIRQRGGNSVRLLRSVNDMEYHLAQVNIARMHADLDDPIMLGFTQRLDEINLLAESSPGFVWRYVSATDEVSYYIPEQDKRILLNMSVWESISALKNYVYHSTHLELLQNKKEWFSKLDRPHLAMWWVAQGHKPDPDEAMLKLDILRDKGSCPEAFTFARPYTTNECYSLV